MTEPTELSAGHFEFVRDLKPNMLTFHGNTGTAILTITNEGKVIGNPDMEADAAAREIIRILEQLTSIPIDERHRVQELLEANTRYLLRARTSEGLLARAVGCMMLVCEDDIKLHEEIKQHLRAPWLLKP